MKFTWDPNKEKINASKHGVTFSQAQEALKCGLVVVLKEESESGEDRYVFLGM